VTGAPGISIAQRRYLDRYCEADLPPPPVDNRRWQHVLVIPAYRESAQWLTRWKTLPVTSGRVLIIVVLNRPDSDNDINANTGLREAVVALPAASGNGEGSYLRTLTPNVDLCVFDTEHRSGPLPASEGVGLARKMGCDLALQWMTSGHIETPWLCCTDADATLPDDYFERLATLPTDTAAAVFPFWHTGEGTVGDATALYELRLHHYVLGLEHAGSPYAFHTLGSCLAVHREAYTQVRGIPKRSGAEDFYLLNKVAKTGSLVRLAGNCVALDARESDRVPFGTGPAVHRLQQATALHDVRMFYHPACFTALRALLDAVEPLSVEPGIDIGATPAVRALPDALRSALMKGLEHLDIASGLAHCYRQGKTPQQFGKQFHQWFDGFRSLKLVHALRDAGWADCSLNELQSHALSLWPTAEHQRADVAHLRHAIARHWGWQRPAPV
jgi:hypothetical protein